MKLILGLGNPGSEYENTRHNVGFICLKRWTVKHHWEFSHDPLYEYLLRPGACVLLPNTFMNRSALALQQAMNRWRITDTLVVHDDIELPLATLRIRNGGGDGGHNGVKSLLSVIPPDALKRVRIGIGRDETDPSDYVLDEFRVDELQRLDPALDFVQQLLDLYLKYDFNTVLDEYSKHKKSYSGDSITGIVSPKEDNNDQKL